MISIRNSSNKKSGFCSALLFFLLLNTVCTTSSKPTASVQTGDLTGLVATRGTGITVEAQYIDGTSRVASADARGRYTFHNLTPGMYRLFASAPGYSRSTSAAATEVLAGQTIEAGPIVLNWTGIGVSHATLAGVITDTDTGLPVEGVFLNVACDPDEIICIGRSAFTDAQGRYTISSIPPDFGFDLFIGKAD